MGPTFYARILSPVHCFSALMEILFFRFTNCVVIITWRTWRLFAWMFLGCLFESFTTQSRPWWVATSLNLSSCSLDVVSESGMRMRLTTWPPEVGGPLCDRSDGSECWCSSWGTHLVVSFTYPRWKSASTHWLIEFPLLSPVTDGLFCQFLLSKLQECASLPVFFELLAHVECGFQHLAENIKERVVQTCSITQREKSQHPGMQGFERLRAMSCGRNLKCLSLTAFNTEPGVELVFHAELILEFIISVCVPEVQSLSSPHHEVQTYTTINTNMAADVHAHKQLWIQFMSCCS